MTSCKSTVGFELLSESRRGDRLWEGGVGRQCDETTEGEGSAQDHLLRQWRDHGGVQHRWGGRRGGAREERRRHRRFGRTRSESLAATSLKPPGLYRSWNTVRCGVQQSSSQLCVWRCSFCFLSLTKCKWPCTWKSSSVQFESRHSSWTPYI